MNRRNVLLSGFGVLALGLCFLGAKPARADDVFNITFPANGVVSDPCTGQMYASTGECHATLRRTVDSSGGVHFGVHEDCHFTLTDLITGAPIGVANSIFDSQIDNSGPPPLEVTTTSHSSQITRGSGDDFIIDVLTHITINADGSVTVTVTDISLECRG
jgi:hypothetical protein